MSQIFNGKTEKYFLIEGIYLNGSTPGACKITRALAIGKTPINDIIFWQVKAKITSRGRVERWIKSNQIFAARLRHLR